jgi:soluble lytic murein transglycosylase-like protein
MPERLRSCFLFLLFAQLPFANAADTIYTATDDDGSVSLSNVPTTRGYRPMIDDSLGSQGAPAFREPRLARLDPAAKARFEGLVEQTAKAYGLESALLHAVISVESGYDASAQSRRGAAGLMQLMPATAKRYGVADVLDPAQNLQGGARYLRYLLKLFDRDLNLVLAAYNAGENSVARHGNRVPPFRETAEYVPRVLAYYRKYQSGG